MNYQRNWKCAAQLKPDGAQTTEESPAPQLPAKDNKLLQTTKYIKKGIITNSNQVPWH